MAERPRLQALLQLRKVLLPLSNTLPRRGNRPIKAEQIREAWAEAKLIDVQITGDTAEGKRQISFPGRTLDVLPVHFRRIDQRWYIHQPNAREAMEMGRKIGQAITERTGQGIVNQTVGYLMRSGSPDSLDLMVARNYAVMAADLALEGASGRMVSLRGGTYPHVPISVTGEGVKRVDITELYDEKNYRPLVRHVIGKPMFLY